MTWPLIPSITQKHTQRATPTFVSWYIDKEAVFESRIPQLINPCQALSCNCHNYYLHVSIQSKTGRQGWQVPCNGFCNCYSRQECEQEPQSTLTRSLMKGAVLSQKGVTFCLIFVLKLFSFPGKLQQELSGAMFHMPKAFSCDVDQRFHSGRT